MIPLLALVLPVGQVLSSWNKFAQVDEAGFLTSTKPVSEREAIVLPSCCALHQEERSALQAG